MFRYWLVALAAAGITTPAVALEPIPYVGVEGGILLRESTDLDEVSVDFADPELPDGEWEDLLRLRYSNGYDINAVAGFDLGVFRIEGELGYKAAKVREDSIWIKYVRIHGHGDPVEKFYNETELKISGKTTVISAMANGLVDWEFDRARVYGGGGVGRAHVSFLGGSENAWAYQLIAGITVPVGSNMEAGLKYRFFRTPRLQLTDSGDFSDAHVTFRNNTRVGSHSLLASFIMNFRSRGRHRGH